jgi:hypothetical protein
MPDEVGFQVRERDVTEDVIEFMNRVKIDLGADHRKRSPRCFLTKTEYCKIPIAEGQVGRAEGGTA